VLAIPPKRFERGVITYLTEPEVNALLAAPGRATWTGRRDHALLLVAVQTRLRASELTGLNCGDVYLDAGPRLRCRGNLRKQRATPLTRATTRELRLWLDERAGQPDQPLFPTRQGRRLSRDALERRLAKHAVAAHACPSLAARRSPCTCSATLPRCGCCTPASTQP
jgi:integrase/recombinase XerD